MNAEMPTCSQYFYSISELNYETINEKIYICAQLSSQYSIGSRQSHLNLKHQTIQILIL